MREEEKVDEKKVSLAFRSDIDTRVLERNDAGPSAMKIPCIFLLFLGLFSLVTP